jgi:hypothetical protein
MQGSCFVNQTMAPASGKGLGLQDDLRTGSRLTASSALTFCNSRNINSWIFYQGKLGIRWEK